MDNESTELINFILENEVELQRKDMELQIQSEQFKTLVEARKTLNEQIESAKKKLKETLPDGKVEKNLGENTLSVNIWTTTRVKEDDFNLIEEKYLKEEELPDVYERDGKYYHKISNIEYVKNLVELGCPVPEGFKKTETKAISIKFNGKTI